MIAKFDFVFHIREKALGSVSMILSEAKNDRAAMEVSQFSRNIQGNRPFNAAFAGDAHSRRWYDGNSFPGRRH